MSDHEIFNGPPVNNPIHREEFNLNMHTARLLMDEPFGALDALNRAQLQEWLLGLWESLGKTIVLVTHDVDEAIFLSDRIHVMTARPGRIKLVVDVELPRPRSLDVVTEPSFVALKARLLASIRDERMPLREDIVI